MMLVFKVIFYHVEYAQVQILLSFSAFEKKHCKGLHGDFFLTFEKLFGGWDHLQIDMIRPLELFKIYELIYPYPCLRMCQKPK